MNFLEFLQPMPVVGILRDIPQGAEEACVKAAAQCGLKAIEVTMNKAAATGRPASFLVSLFLSQSSSLTRDLSI